MLNMRRFVSPDPHADARLLGILLAGMLEQTRPECGREARLELERRPSGIHRIVRPQVPEKPDS